MIYLVSKNQSLFKSEKYKKIELNQAIELLSPIRIIQGDTETMGLDCHTKELLTLQLGNKDNQIVFDWTTLDTTGKALIKNLMEDNFHTFIFHNAQFDLTFLYKQNIWPKHIIDTMIIEQLIYLGLPTQFRGDQYKNVEYINPDLPYDDSYTLSFALNHIAKRRLGIDIDKSVRGKITTQGLTEDVIEYAGNDVVWLEDIYISQLEDLKRENLEKAAVFECAFVKCLAYIKYCGVHLDVNKWRAKMTEDQLKLDAAEKALNTWVVNWEKEHLLTVQGVKACLTYVDINSPIADKIKERLIKLGFIRYYDKELSGKECYIMPYNGSFSKIDKQGNLFTGFNLEPQCTINWSSAQQVIPLFELLGIGVKTFDKKTKGEKKTIEAKQLAPQKEFFEIIPLFLQYQKAGKLVSTYGQNWINAINPNTKRIHLELHCLGTDTARVSSGGGPYKLNIQNLPHDALTRSCFTAETGNSWISIDYQSQESRLIASVSQDQAMIDIFTTGCGDVHSLVAKMSYSSIIPDTIPVEEIKEKYPSFRQDAKGIEFAINYGGDAHTIATNKGIPQSEAEEIYNNFMKGFPGIKQYQDYCRQEVKNKWYILMNNCTFHRAHIYDSKWLAGIQSQMQSPDFWKHYAYLKKHEPTSSEYKDYKRYFIRIKDLEKQSINFRIQNRGAGCFKLSAIYFFNWIIENNYQNIVKICVPAHDEFNIECPKEIDQIVANKIQECMVNGAKPFCPNLFLGADISISDHWIH